MTSQLGQFVLGTDVLGGETKPVMICGASSELGKFILGRSILGGGPQTPFSYLGAYSWSINQPIIDFAAFDPFSGILRAIFVKPLGNPTIIDLLIGTGNAQQALTIAMSAPNTNLQKQAYILNLIDILCGVTSEQAQFILGESTLGVGMLG